MAALVRVEHLVKHFAIERSAKLLQAVSDVSFSIEAGETLGIVGESGSGKTTVGRCVLRLIEPTSGRVSVGEQDLAALSQDHIRLLRPKMQLVFQEPFDSLDPQMTVGRIIAEPLRLHTTLGKAERDDRVIELLTKVGLSPQTAGWYPHQLAAGQQQRVGIARAIATEPGFIVLDEPVSSLDPTARAEIIDLLIDLQERLAITYLFISHDLTTVRYLCNRVAVMYLGKIVEMSPTDELFERPVHPYTRALLSAVPAADPEIRQPKFVLKGEIPSPINLPTGCHLHTRCPAVTAACRTIAPELEAVGEQHWVACLRAREPGFERNFIREAGEPLAARANRSPDVPTRRMAAAPSRE
jgi:oligopeptide/dipeptide ABC transporter ATP-binding protein